MRTNSMCAILGSVSHYPELRPLTEKRTLDSLPFDCKYRLIDFPLSSIANSGLHSIFMVFNDGETYSVFDHISGGKEWHLDSLQNRYFVYFYQDFLKKKVAGLPYYATVIDYLEKSHARYTVFLGSNIVCNVDLQQLLAAHKKHNQPITVTYKQMPRTDFSLNDGFLTFTDDQQVAQIKPVQTAEESATQLPLNMNTFLVDTDWLIGQLKLGQKRDSPINLHAFIKEKVSEVGAGAYEYPGYLSNIYDIPSYYKANLAMLEPTAFHSLYFQSQKVYTKVKNEVPTYYAAHSSVTNSRCATGCVIKGQVSNSLIARNTCIEAAAVVQDAIVMANAKIEPGAKVTHAILDKNVTVKAGVVITGQPQRPVVIAKGQTITEDITGG